MRREDSQTIRGRIPEYHPIQRALKSASESRRRLMQLAVNEAEAAAYQSGVPDLVFLTLAEEKLEALHEWIDRQEKVRVRTAQWSLSE